MANRTLVKDLAALPDGPVAISGWVETLRDQKRIQFVQGRWIPVLEAHQQALLRRAEQCCLALQGIMRRSER